MKNKLQKGFTLIELLVVIAIIGILASVVLTSVQNARVGAREAAAKSAMSQVRVAMEVYYDNNNTYAAPSTVAPDAVQQVADNAGGTVAAVTRGGGNVASYALAVNFPAEFDSQAWCIDGAGSNSAITDTQYDAMAATATVCP